MNAGHRSKRVPQGFDAFHGMTADQSPLRFAAADGENET